MWHAKSLLLEVLRISTVVDANSEDEAIELLEVLRISTVVDHTCCLKRIDFWKY